MITGVYLPQVFLNSFCPNPVVLGIMETFLACLAQRYPNKGLSANLFYYTRSNRKVMQWSMDVGRESKEEVVSNEYGKFGRSRRIE